MNNSELKFAEFYDLLHESNVFSLKIIVFLLILSILNWFFEILKWQNLVSVIKKITLTDALKQSLAALTASLFTPNRIGDYGAKTLFYSTRFTKQILLLNLLSNMLQMLITIVFGIIGLSAFCSTYHIDINYLRFSKLLVIFLLTLILIGFGFKKSKFSFFNLKQFVLNFPKQKIVICLFLSVLRYAIFSFQFYALLVIFNIDIDYLAAMVFITSMYILVSTIPSIVILDVVVKGSIAVYLFAFYPINELITLSIILLMWILNFVIPSLIGSYFVLAFKLPRATNRII